MGQGFRGSGVTAVAAVGVDQVVGHLGKFFNQVVTQFLINDLLGQRLRHAQHPLIAHGRTDRVRRMAHAQTGVAIFGDVRRRPAKPTREILKQVFCAAFQAFRVQLPHGIGFWQFIHQLIKAVYQALYAKRAAQGLVGGYGNGFIHQFFSVQVETTCAGKVATRAKNSSRDKPAKKGCQRRCSKTVLTPQAR